MNSKVLAHKFWLSDLKVKKYSYVFLFFVTYTEKGMRDAEASSFGITIDGKAISNLRYADDTVLIETSKEALEHLSKNVNEVGKQLNLCQED